MGVDRLVAQLQFPILTLSLAGRALHLSVVAAGLYPQDSAHHPHRVVGPLRMNELKSHSPSFLIFLALAPTYALDAVANGAHHVPPSSEPRVDLYLDQLCIVSPSFEGLIPSGPVS